MKRVHSLRMSTQPCVLSARFVGVALTYLFSLQTPEYIPLLLEEVGPPSPRTFFIHLSTIPEAISASSVNTDKQRWSKMILTFHGTLGRQSLELEIPPKTPNLYGHLVLPIYTQKSTVPSAGSNAVSTETGTFLTHLAAGTHSCHCSLTGS